jgi:arsenite methyltransferase
VAGALAERDFVEKLTEIGFVDVDVVDRRPFGIEDAEIYPLFTEDLRSLMRSLIPPKRQDRIATSVVVKARLG